MTYIVKPVNHHPNLERNDLGLTRRDYEGTISTLCAGCGHDSISAAVIEACYDLSLSSDQIAKLSGIGCSSKSPSYFLNQAHGFNSVHGRWWSKLRLDVLRTAVYHLRAAFGDVLYFRRSLDGRFIHHGQHQHHRDHFEHACARHDPDENADVRLDVVDYRFLAGRSDAGVSGRRDDDANGYSLWHELLFSGRRW